MISSMPSHQAGRPFVIIVTVGYGPVEEAVGPPGRVEAQDHAEDGRCRTTSEVNSTMVRGRASMMPSTSCRRWTP